MPLTPILAKLPELFADQAMREIGRPPIEEVSDVELISKTIAGKPMAFEEIYRRFSSGMFSVAFAVLSCRADSEDVIQEVFAYLWLNARDFDATRAPLGKWLNLLVRGRSIDRLRNRIRSTRRFDREIELTTIVFSERIENLERAETKITVRKVLAKLRIEEKDTIVRAYFRGEPHAQISIHSGVPLGTVKARIRRGLAKMKALLRVEGILQVHSR